MYLSIWGCSERSYTLLCASATAFYFFCNTRIAFFPFNCEKCFHFNAFLQKTRRRQTARRNRTRLNAADSLPYREQHSYRGLCLHRKLMPLRKVCAVCLNFSFGLRAYTEFISKAFWSRKLYCLFHLSEKAKGYLLRDSPLLKMNLWSVFSNGFEA